MREKIDIYWSPSPFSKNSEQWNFLYREPSPIANCLPDRFSQNSEMLKCPAVKNTTKNVFALQSNIEERVDLSVLDWDYYYNMENPILEYLPVESKVSLFIPRKSSIQNHINISYNLGWLFFCEESVEIKVTAPYFPSVSPTNKSIMSPGSFDIGKWFRPINLDYHIPVGSESFIVKENDPLAFIEFQTNKKINFVRFKNTPLLQKYGKEFAESPNRYKARLSLFERYKMSKRSGAMSLVKDEIFKNLIT